MKKLRFSFHLRIPAVLLACAGISLLSCTNENLGISPCDLKIPDEVTFKNDVLPLIQSNCSISGCHSGTNPAGHLNLEDSLAYDKLLQSGSGYIKVGNPKSSIVYLELTAETNYMPPSGKLSDCEVELVLRWIEQGAVRE